MTIEKYSGYEFCVKPYESGELEDGWVYVIYDPDYKSSEETIIRESGEWFYNAQEARFAAIGHINLLENGEG